MSAPLEVPASLLMLLSPIPLFNALAGPLSRTSVSGPAVNFSSRQFVAAVRSLVRLLPLFQREEGQDVAAAGPLIVFHVQARSFRKSATNFKPAVGLSVQIDLESLASVLAA